MPASGERMSRERGLTMRSKTIPGSVILLMLAATPAAASDPPVPERIPDAVATGGSPAISEAARKATGVPAPPRAERGRCRRADAPQKIRIMGKFAPARSSIRRSATGETPIANEVDVHPIASML